MVNIKWAMKSERLMKAITGLSIREFYGIVPDFEKNIKGHFKKNRHVNPELGRAFILETPEEKLFFILFYCRCYPTFDVASFFFGVDRSSCCRWAHWFIGALEITLGEKCVFPKRKLKCADDVLCLIPEIEELFIDGTERPIRRPHNNDRQKEFYSGKKKRHTMKNLIIANNRKEIIAVTKTCEGKTHDYKTFKNEEISSAIPKGMPVFVDNGFQGIQSDFPQLNVFMPKRKPKGKELSESEKNQNTSISSKRVLIEHVIGGIKRFKSTSDIYRNIKKGFEDSVIMVAAGLWNYHLKMV
jgi:hypothetical protein